MFVCFVEQRLEVSLGEFGDPAGSKQRQNIGIANGTDFLVIGQAAAGLDIGKIVRSEIFHATLDGALGDPAFQPGIGFCVCLVFAGATGLGCTAEIVTVPGYLPTIPLENPDLLTGVLQELSEEEKGRGRDYPVSFHNRDYHSGGSTDFGEVSSILPLYQFNTGCYTGELHNSTVRVTD